MNGFTLAHMPVQSGRTAIVTGANTGIGFAIAEALVKKGARVLLACRDADKAQAAMSRINENARGGDMGFLELDLADLASIELAAEAAKGEQRIDLLINNAGVMMPPLGHAIAGMETQFAVNHLGHFVFTALLLGKLAEDGGGRVVVQSSIAHRGADIDFDNLAADKGYDRTRFYGQSKLANLLFAKELDRRLRAAGSPVAALACHPGIAASELMRHVRGGSVMNAIVGKVLNDADQGALPALQAATDPEAQGGDYYGPYGLMEAKGKTSGRAIASEKARDADLARRLWDVSVELTGTDPGLPPA